MKREGPILFRGMSRAYWPFSNWYPSPVEIADRLWPTTEHFYMAMKTDDRDKQEIIRAAKTPREARRLGQPEAEFLTLRDGWDDIRYAVMLLANREKYKQHQALGFLLLSTGSRPIHEDLKDLWWGGGPNNPTGKDWLGKILLQVRAELRELGFGRTKT